MTHHIHLSNWKSMVNIDNMNGVLTFKIPLWGFLEGGDQYTHREVVWRKHIASSSMHKVVLFGHHAWYTHCSSFEWHGGWGYGQVGEGIFIGLIKQTRILFFFAMDAQQRKVSYGQKGWKGNSRTYWFLLVVIIIFSEVSVCQEVFVFVFGTYDKEEEKHMFDWVHNTQMDISNDTINDPYSFWWWAYIAMSQDDDVNVYIHHTSSNNQRSISRSRARA